MEDEPGPSTNTANKCTKRVPRLRSLHNTHEELENYLKEIVNDELDERDIDDSDNDPDYEEESDHLTDSEQSAGEEVIIGNIQESLNVNMSPSSDINFDEQEEDLNGSIRMTVDNQPVLSQETNQNPNRQRGSGTFYYGRRTQEMRRKNIPAFRWKKEEGNQNVRTRQNNIITHLPGLKATALNLGENPDIEDVWNLVFTQDILNEVIQWTNVKIDSLVHSYKGTSVSYVNHLDMIELRAFIGFLLYTAVFKSNNESVLSLFATDGTGRDIFRCIMTKERFLFLLRVLRFDNPCDREERKKEDKSAAVSNIFNKFIQASQSLYTMGVSTTIDEMLVPFRGRSSFRMYMPKKPAKYGLKVMCLTDAKSSYLFNAFIYTGKGSYGNGLTNDQKSKLIPTQSVLKLIKPIEKTRRNITADNWFSSVELVEELNKLELTYTGTLKKNKTEVPVEFLPHKSKEVGSTVYGFTENLTLVSYVPKQSKAVLLISSMHHGRETDVSSGKPEIIAEYNRTKAGVDTIDQICSNYSCSRRTRRWPMAIFFQLINLSAGVNAYALYKSYKNTEDISRLEFLKKLAKSLVTPHMLRRLDRGHITLELSLTIKRILRVRADTPPHQQVLEVRKTCSTCPPRLKRKTKYPCVVCAKPICLECSKKVCMSCIRNIND